MTPKTIQCRNFPDEPLWFFFLNTPPDQYPIPMVERRRPYGLKSFDRKTVAVTKLRLCAVLDDIVERGAIVDSKPLRHFLDIREKMHPAYTIEGGRLIEGWRFGQGVDPAIYPYWQRDIAKSFVDFLASPKFNPKKLKKCPHCNRYFIAKSAARIGSCYNSECVRAERRDRKRKQRERDPVRYSS